MIFDLWRVQPWENFTWKSYRFVHLICQMYLLYLGKSKKSFSTVLFIHTSDYLCYLRQIQTVIHQPTPLENVTTLTCAFQNFFLSDWRFVAFFQALEALKRASCGLSSVALKTGCDAWQQERKAHNVTESVHDHFLHQYMLPVFFNTDQSHSTPCCAEIQPLSQQAAAASLNMSISIHALVL